MRESKVECYLYVRVKELGGECYKFTSPQRRNVPDRIVILPGGRLTFVEVKAPGEKPTDGQQREHKRLWELGVAVVVLDSYEAIDSWLGKK